MAGTSSYTTTNSDSVWSIWVDSTASTTNGSDYIWQAWTSGTSAISGNITYQASSIWHDVYVSAPPETEEQRQARIEREQRLEEGRQIALREKEAAREKARELLRESLDDDQRKQFDETKWFYVISQSGKRYRIRHDWFGNVDELNEDDMVVAQYCIHPKISVPNEDAMLVQKLMLEVDENRFMEIANKTTLATPRPVAI